ncbi:membrane-associated phospholipid phosphatase [Nocardioides ginsengisegetis]|uniref:Membrane-associated phospholipid phosphatase n=1 Tax=Nocardioides ginsengisegetis TaxID=661491 RepID=A0A7W3IXM8_9ACTN|nr:phosphatase PAP2 family protein [Nocardioides ginsengisegetis]MBA8802552.1 membrane-associated phospholipid phosphatase [Nocardioides ginsengisegetis]
MELTAPPPVTRRRTPTGVPADAGRGRWLIGVGAVVVVFALVTAYWSHHVGVPVRDPGGAMFLRRLPSAVVLFGLLAVADAALRAPAGQRFRDTLATLRARWPRERLVVALGGLVAYHVVYLCYRNMKSWNAFRDLKDTELLRLDRALFGGHDPGALLHSVLGQHWAAYALMVFYKAFTYLVPLSVVASLVFLDRLRDGYVFLVAAMWVWILGVASYYLAPSLGPYVSDAPDFAGLPHTAITSTQAEYLTERAHMLAHPQASDAFVSLGAFASLHVAFTCLVFLMVRHYGFARLTRVMGVYLVLVMVATVYLGWHYFVDDVAGLVIAATAVGLGRLMVYPTGRPD